MGGKRDDSKINISLPHNAKLLCMTIFRVSQTEVLEVLTTKTSKPQMIHSSVEIMLGTVITTAIMLCNLSFYLESFC